MAIVHYHQGHHKEALDYFEHILALDPQHEDALLASARIIEEEDINHLNGVAFDRLARLVQLGKDDATMYFSLAMLAAKASKYDQARHLFEQAIERKQSFAEAHYNLGLLLVKEIEILNSNQYEKRHWNVQLALMHLKKVLVINPRHDKSMLVLGDLYADELQQVDTARMYYQMVIDRVQPNHLRARHNLCVLWNKQNDLDQAIGCFQRLQQDLVRNSEHIDSIQTIELQIQVLIEARQTQWAKQQTRNKLVKWPKRHYCLNESSHVNTNSAVETKYSKYFKNLMVSKQLSGMCLI